MVVGTNGYKRGTNVWYNFPEKMVWWGGWRNARANQGNFQLSTAFSLSSNEDDDFDVLPPAHFLVNRSLNSIVKPNLTNLKESNLKRWQKITRIV